MEQDNVRELFVTEKIRNFAYNFRYKAIALFEEYSLESALSAYQTSYLLGREFSTNPANVKEINKQLAQTFRQIIWITYRSGFPQLLKDSGCDSSFVTDTGWGCMIRVGQMLFAEILKSYLKPTTKEQFTAICDHFNDFRSDKIARVGNKQFNLVPGQWYNPAQIAYILSDLLNETKEKSLSNLKSIIFNNSSLFYDEIIKNFDPQRIKECHHKNQIQAVHKKKIICSECNYSQKNIAIIILLRLGLDRPESQYLKILDELMTIKWFRGLIGGKPKRALYFVGRKEDQYVYLDPHYVQTAQKDIFQSKNSYFCESFRRCKNTNIDPSLGICFYLESLQQLNMFYETMNKMKQTFQDFFIYAAEQTPAYLRQTNSSSIPVIAQISEMSGIYQVL